jgi:Rap1a immunity proteins
VILALAGNPVSQVCRRAIRTNGKGGLKKEGERWDWWSIPEFFILSWGLAFAVLAMIVLMPGPAIQSFKRFADLSPSMTDSFIMTRLAVLLVSLLVASSQSAVGAAGSFDDVLGSYACRRSTVFCHVDFLTPHDDGFPNLCVEAVRICRAVRQRNVLAFRIAWRTWKITKISRDFFREYNKTNNDWEGLNVFSAGQLLEVCRDSGKKEQQACRSYSSSAGSAAIDQGRVWMNGGEDRSYPADRACSSQDISVDEYVQVFLEWAEKHPERVNDRVGVDEAVIAATKAKWPCSDPP